MKVRIKMNYKEFKVIRKLKNLIRNNQKINKNKFKQNIIQVPK